MPVTVKTAIMRQTFISSPSPQSSSFCTNHSSPADLATTTSHRPHLTKHAISDILNHRLDGQPLVLISWKSWAAFLKDRLRDNYAKPLPDFKNCFKSKPPPLPFLPSLLGETGQVGAQGPGRQWLWCTGHQGHWVSLIFCQIASVFLLSPRDNSNSAALLLARHGRLFSSDRNGSCKVKLLKDAHVVHQILFEIPISTSRLINEHSCMECVNVCICMYSWKYPTSQLHVNSLFVAYVHTCVNACVHSYTRMHWQIAIFSLWYEVRKFLRRIQLSSWRLAGQSCMLSCDWIQMRNKLFPRKSLEVVLCHFSL